MPETRVRNDVPNSRVSMGLPISRVTSFQGGIRSQVTKIRVGMPIGLLLALTYSKAITFSIQYLGEGRPNSYVKSI